MVERVVRREARAKINVFLRVAGRRADGYHDIETLITPVSLADELTVRTGPELRLQVRGDEPLIANVPTDERNLLVTAARELGEVCGVDPLAEITIHKRIPVAAGLGGGSADAAACLWALNELWSCGLDGAALAELGLLVGSDVPALVMERPVIAAGRGEVFEPADVRPLWWVLVTHPFIVSAADAYRWWDEDAHVAVDRETDAVLAAASSGDPVAVGRGLFNDLEEPVSRRHPEIARTKERVIEEGALGAVMCGSGPTVAGLARDEGHAGELAEAFSPAFVVVGPP
jgi:4-diphosphocytidyl-2-C-methyl-D-erythritol kinase